MRSKKEIRLSVIKKIFKVKPRIVRNKTYVTIPILTSPQLKDLHNSGLECRTIIHNHKNCGQHLILIQVGVKSK